MSIGLHPDIAEISIGWPSIYLGRCPLLWRAGCRACSARRRFHPDFQRIVAGEDVVFVPFADGLFGIQCGVLWLAFAIGDRGAQRNIQAGAGEPCRYCRATAGTQSTAARTTSGPCTWTDTPLVGPGRASLGKHHSDIQVVIKTDGVVEHITFDRRVSRPRHAVGGIPDLGGIDGFIHQNRSASR